MFHGTALFWAPNKAHILFCRPFPAEDWKRGQAAAEHKFRCGAGGKGFGNSPLLQTTLLSRATVGLGDAVRMGWSACGNPLSGWKFRPFFRFCDHQSHGKRIPVCRKMLFYFGFILGRPLVAAEISGKK